ncbi:MAG: cmtH [Blastococcus sp.]|nr:cmtH [Blastococcus sp.]
MRRDVTDVQSGLLLRAAGARRFAFNWAVAKIKANADQWAYVVPPVAPIPAGEPVHTLLPDGAGPVTTKVTVFLEVDGSAHCLPAYAEQPRHHVLGRPAGRREHGPADRRGGGRVTTTTPAEAKPDL